jgi:hypothetical protein
MRLEGTRWGDPSSRGRLGTQPSHSDLNNCTSPGGSGGYRTVPMTCLVRQTLEFSGEPAALSSFIRCKSSFASPAERVLLAPTSGAPAGLTTRWRRSASDSPRAQDRAQRVVDRVGRRKRCGDLRLERYQRGSLETTGVLAAETGT